MKYTKDEILSALTSLGQRLGFNVDVPKTNASEDEGDQSDAVVAVHFNEAEGNNELAAMVSELGGVAKVKEALTAALEFKAKANAEAQAESAKRNDLIAALSQEPAIGMDADELGTLPTNTLVNLTNLASGAKRNSGVDYSARAAGTGKTNAADKIAPRPSVLLGNKQNAKAN